MKISKPVENWTKFPNCILDNLAQFTANELKVIAFMVRKNLGFQNPNMKYSVRYVSLNTGISKPTTIKAIDGLIEKGSIILVKTDDSGTRFFDINWIEPEVKEIDRSKNFTGSGKETLPDPVKKFDQIKENIKRKHINKTTSAKQFNFNDKKQHEDFVYLTDEQYNKLVKDYGKPIIDKNIASLDYYLTNNPEKRPGGKKQYMDHYKVLTRQWLKDVPTILNEQQESQKTKSYHEFMAEQRRKMRAM
jgi:hypothetical protein